MAHCDACLSASPNAAIRWARSHSQELFLPGGIYAGREPNAEPSSAINADATARSVVATMRRWLHGAADARSLGVCEADPCVACAWATAGRRRYRLRRAARRFPRSVGDHFYVRANIHASDEPALSTRPHHAASAARAAWRGQARRVTSLPPARFVARPSPVPQWRPLGPHACTHTKAR
jgi:hypothetical protein